MQLQTMTATGKTGTLTVSDSVFAAPVNKVLLAQAARVYTSNERQGTAKVKTRSEVNISRRKIYKQKGTGGARHGAKSAPIFVGGGVTHGPTGGQNWSLSLSQKLKHKALICALSWQNDQIIVVDEITKISGKTKAVVELLTAVAPKATRVLIVLPQEAMTVQRAFNNVQSAVLVTANQVSVIDILRADKIIMTSEAIKIIEKRLDGSVRTSAEKPVVTAPKAKPAVVKAATKKPTAAKTVAKPKKVAAKK